jgi:hypothetical protein
VEAQANEGDSNTNIPEELFKNAAANYLKRDATDEESESNFPSSIRLLDHQTLFLSGGGVWEKMKFLAGIRALVSFALIEAHNQLYSMHILVHSWNRNRVPKAEATHLCQKARALLSCSVDLDYRIDNYVFCKLLAPHVGENALHTSELELKRIYYDDEYERFTLVFDHVGNWDEPGGEAFIGNISCEDNSTWSEPPQNSLEHVSFGSHIHESGKVG